MIRLWLFLTPLVSIALSYKEDDSLSDYFVSFGEFVDDYYSHFCTGAVIEAEKFSILLPAHCLDARYAQYYPSKENHIYVRFALQFNSSIPSSVWYFIQKIKVKTRFFDSQTDLALKGEPTYVTQWRRDEYKSVGDLCVAQVKGSIIKDKVDVAWTSTNVLKRADKDFYLIRKISYDPLCLFVLIEGAY